MNYYVTDNTGASVALNDIPEVSYAAFYEDLRVKLSDAGYHAAHYFALPSGDRMRFFLLLLDDAERRVLERALAQCRGNRTAAGQRLGLTLRQMRYRMARLRIQLDGSD